MAAALGRKWLERTAVLGLRRGTWASSPLVGVASTSAGPSASGFLSPSLSPSLDLLRWKGTKGGGSENDNLPLYAREPLKDTSDLSQFVSHDVHDKPWMPSSQRTKRKRQTKTAKYMLELIEREQVAKANARFKIPDFKAGDILEVKTIVPENMRKVAAYKGICIARRNRGMGSSFIIRNVIEDSAFELHFPTYSPLIQNIKILEKGKAKRKKLYHLREWPDKYSKV